MQEIREDGSEPNAPNSNYGCALPLAVAIWVATFYVSTQLVEDPDFFYVMVMTTPYTAFLAYFLAMKICDRLDI